VWYDITKREGGGGTTHQEMHVEDLRRIIREAGQTPVERDTLYRPLVRGPVQTVETPREVVAAAR
jgi:aminodeoxyfutalosine synthase